jgi:hypothetical protein
VEDIFLVSHFAAPVPGAARHFEIRKQIKMGSVLMIHRSQNRSIASKKHKVFDVIIMLFYEL